MRCRWILWVAAVVLLVGISLAWASTTITNTGVMTYTDSAGVTHPVSSNTMTSKRLDPPILAGVPVSILPGTESALTMTGELGPDYPTHSLLLPTSGGAYVAGSLLVTGAVGTITSTTPAGVTVSFPKPSVVTSITCTYRVKWN